MKKIILTIILQILVFYVLFPQAISFFGYSFIFTSAGLGLVWYINNRNPFKEVFSIIGYYMPIFLACLVAGFMVSYYDDYIIDYPKSQIAWVFSSYLIVCIFFQIYPRGTLIQFTYLIIGAILLQCIISVIMYVDEGAKNFFNSLQMMDAVAAYKRDETEGARLLGYGIAFFGMGIVCGVGLILLVFVTMTQKLSLLKLSLHVVAYTFIFYVGLFSARTTVVGFVASIILFVILLLMKKSTFKQSARFLAIGLIVASIGYTLCYTYFTEFADWAFELFINYEETGELRTESSDALEYMFQLPQNFHQWIFGIGGMAYWGPDVGYTRLLFYFGLPGTIVYFLYQFLLMRMCVTRNTAFNITLIVLFAYNLGLNVKGLSDLNHFIYLFVFYFLYYKYFIYTPYLYKIGKINTHKLRHAVQSQKASRGI